MKRLLTGFCLVSIALLVMGVLYAKQSIEISELTIQKQEMVDLYLNELESNFERYMMLMPEPNPFYRDGFEYWNNIDPLETKEL